MGDSEEGAELQIKHLANKNFLLCSSDFVGIQRLLVAFAFVLKLVGKQGLFGAHRGEPDLVVIIVSVLAQTVEAIFLAIRLSGTHAPDDARCHHQCCHGGGCGEEQNIHA